MGEWDDHDAYTGEDSTKYTKCWFCRQSYPLRDIAEHARRAHPKESTKYTKCWHCNEEFPLNQIREHARGCRTKVGSTG